MFDKYSREAENKVAREIAIEIVKILAEKELKYSVAELSLELAKEELGELKIRS
ncbi:MAG: hypothetical protein KH415_23620 [Clostridium sp.]|nr:hypothetical protein [Clostridium sp.]